MIYQKTGEHILTGLAMSTYYLEDIQQKKSEYFCYKGKDLLYKICYDKQFVTIWTIKQFVTYTMKNLIEML